MADREAPGDTEDLYEARGDVPLARPVMQGDVFADVLLPGLTDEPGLVLITQHPCSMRAGPVLRPRLSVALVKPNARIAGAQWQGFANVMPLPEMTGPGGDSFVADFRESSAIPSADLSREKRVAALSNYGIAVLQQRLIFYLTRFTVEVPVLATTFDAIATETELQYEWVEAALENSEGQSAPLEVIADAEGKFQAYLDDGYPTRRQRLQDQAMRADVRREVRRQIEAQF